MKEELSYASDVVRKSPNHCMCGRKSRRKKSECVNAAVSAKLLLGRQRLRDLIMPDTAITKYIEGSNRMAYLNVRTERCPVCGRKPVIKAIADEFTMDFSGTVEVICKRPFRRTHLRITAVDEDIRKAVRLAVNRWNQKASNISKQGENDDISRVV